MAKRKTSLRLSQGGQTNFQKQQAVQLTKEQKAARSIEKAAAKMYFEIMFPKKGK